MDGTWAIVAATFLGPIVAVAITRLHDRYTFRRERQMYVFRALMSTRKMRTAQDHVIALNLVEIEFYDHLKVIKAWKDYIAHLNSMPEPKGERRKWADEIDRKLAILLSEIASSLKFQIREMDIYQGGYAPDAWRLREESLNELHDWARGLATHKNALPILVYPHATTERV